MPINHIPKDCDDPRIEEGIQRIRELDDKLKEAALKVRQYRGFLQHHARRCSVLSELHLV